MQKEEKKKKGLFGWGFLGLNKGGRLLISSSVVYLKVLKEQLVVLLILLVKL